MLYAEKNKTFQSHHHLKSLGLSSCDNMVEAMVDSPILCRLSYYDNTSNISISLNALDLLEVKYLCFSGYCSWNVERIKFLSKMRNLKVFELSSFSFKVFPYLIIYLIHKVFGLVFFFFFLAATFRGGTMVEETEREKWRETFLGLEISLECNKWG